MMTTGICIPFRKKFTKLLTTRKTCLMLSRNTMLSLSLKDFIQLREMGMGNTWQEVLLVTCSLSWWIHPYLLLGDSLKTAKCGVKEMVAILLFIFIVPEFLTDLLVWSSIWTCSSSKKYWKQWGRACQNQVHCNAGIKLIVHNSQVDAESGENLLKHSRWALWNFPLPNLPF